ncbi:MAG: NAD(P)/FAD-dependent oxidoreductase [Candidatus Levybacteria bacterium]|nr:NAD(P)/FAD-dependent oxidoreductase [Candidatus Levybacteria bacterium]
MRIAIIGAGFTGLSAAYYLQKDGHSVTIFEKDPHPGGLAIGFREKEWEWSLEKHYHHWFTNDKFILRLAKEIGHKVIVRRPKTSVYVDGKIYQFDSPLKVLLFPKLSIIDRLRMGFVISLLRYNPIWKPLEKINATKFLPKAMGQRGYKMIWEPLFKNKFGPYASDISLAWFWARIVKRTPSLAYPQGGFLEFANHIVKVIEKRGGKVYFNTDVVELSSNGKPSIKFKKIGNAQKAPELEIGNYDAIVVTLPSFLFFKIAPELPQDYKQKFAKLRGLGATNLMLRLRKPFFNDGTYWLNVCDETSPVMAIVEHTNFMDKKYYNNEHLLYLGNYLPADSKRFSLEKEEVLKLLDPFLQKINPNYRKSLIDYALFKVSFAQPVIPTNYSKMIPPFKTPLPNVYLSNIEQVYPWDRGTNYAVELGEEITDYILNEN